MDLLKEAADGLSAGGTDDLGIGDVLFFGDTDAWLRLANTPKGSTAYDRAISTVTQSLTRVAQASQKEAQ